ncbi:MAG: nitroreductase family protein [Bacteroidaceae bacterium]|nr:nitroreductase family protein [Bacteroidaceae bacterium]
MNFLTLTQNRYSCRNYQDKAVEQEKLNYVMECVRMAPSAVNRQPWRFRIFSSVADKAKLQQCYNRDWFATAPLYIVASILHDEEWVRADGKPHGNIDIAIAVEHLCLAATEQGLGTCWVCNFDAALCSQLFALPQNEEPAVIIPIGYPAVEATVKKRKTMEEILGK